MSEFNNNYSETGFWSKVGKFAKKAGKGVLTNALRLYYAMKLGKATAPQVAAILAALGYFISPIDAIPDLLPGGLADDAGVLATAVATLACCADPEVIRMAERKAQEWLG